MTTVSNSDCFVVLEADRDHLGVWTNAQTWGVVTLWRDCACCLRVCRRVLSWYDVTGVEEFKNSSVYNRKEAQAVRQLAAELQAQGQAKWKVGGPRRNHRLGTPLY